MSRLFIAALHVSLDDYLQGANGEVDWVDSWGDALGLVPAPTRPFLAAARTRATRPSGHRSRPIREAHGNAGA